MLLETLNLPADLKKMSAPDLELLAVEIRQLIIEAVSSNGGHLSSNLGVIELAIALHTIFDSPKDKIIWDVGHQSYAHKILTSRSKHFHTLRKYKGVSGYPSIDESPHDQFTSGHASTAISLGMGMTQAKQLTKEEYKVVSIIGDGSFPGGISLEALNNMMRIDGSLIVVLNDNEMSISKNVGAFSDYFTNIRMNPLYTKTKERVENLVKRIPKFGEPLFHLAEKLKNRLKNFVIDFHPEVIVEEFGIEYLGPIDGHNITLLMSALSFAKELKKPILVHLLTKKGKGYGPAEKDPTRFHSAGPFNIETGAPKLSNKIPTYTEVFGKTLVELAAIDKKITGITAAMLDGTGLDDFAKKYPDRFFDVGIAEEHAVVFAAGLAKGGLRPVCAIYSTFLQRSYDEIFHDICLQNLPVVFCLDRAGIVGDDGPTHNGVFDIAYLRHLPNMTMMAPKDGNEFRNMLFTAFKHAGPVSIRYPKAAAADIEIGKEFELIETGKGEVLYRSPGKKQKNILIIALGSMVYPSLESIQELENSGLQVTLVNARFIKPLDRELIIAEAKKTDLLLTVEEGCLQGGFGSSVLELLEEENLQIPVKRIGLPDKFIEAGNRDFILDLYGLSADGIVKKITHDD